MMSYEALKEKLPKPSSVFWLLFIYFFLCSFNVIGSFGRWRGGCWKWSKDGGGMSSGFQYTDREGGL